jgi:hypothetical protein
MTSRSIRQVWRDVIAMPRGGNPEPLAMPAAVPPTAPAT